MNRGRILCRNGRILAEWLVRQSSSQSPTAGADATKTNNGVSTQNSSSVYESSLNSTLSTFNGNFHFSDIPLPLTRERTLDRRKEKPKCLGCSRKSPKISAERAQPTGQRPFRSNSTLLHNYGYIYRCEHFNVLIIL